MRHKGEFGEEAIRITSAECEAEETERLDRVARSFRLPDMSVEQFKQELEDEQA